MCILCCSVFYLCVLQSIVPSRAHPSFAPKYNLLTKFIQFTDTTSQGKHKKSARRNLDEVKTFLAKVDAHLAEIAETSGAPAAAAAGGESSAKTNKAEAKTPASGKKRKPSSDAGSSKESSKKKKAVKEDLGPLTIPQREQRALEQLGIYLEEIGGESSSFVLFD